MDEENKVTRLEDSEVEVFPAEPIAPASPEPNFTAAEGGEEIDTAYEGSTSDNATTGTYESSTSGSTTNTYETNTGSSTAYVVDDDNDTKVLAIVSLVTGIISILFCCSVWVGSVLSIVAIVTGIISLKKEGDKVKGLAIAGIACGSVGFVCALITLVFIGIGNAFSAIFDLLD